MLGWNTIVNRIEKRRKQNNFYDGNIFPFENEMFESIVMFEVFEHVFNPNQFIREISRVLKSKGYLLITVPFIWDEHEQPYDYARYSSFGLKAIFEENGFEVIEHRKTNPNISVVFQLTNAYIYKIFMNRNKYIREIINLLCCSIINILGTVFSRLLPNNPDLYLDNIIVLKKKEV